MLDGLLNEYIPSSLYLAYIECSIQYSQLTNHFLICIQWAKRVPTKGRALSERIFGQTSTRPVVPLRAAQAVGLQLFEKRIRCCWEVTTANLTANA